MAIEFTCPQCQRRLRVPDEAAGREAQCPECSTRIIVPAAAASPFAQDVGQGPGEAWNPYTSPQGTGPTAPQPDQWPRREIPNYLAQAILVTLFCCWPFGIPAIVFAARVGSKQAIGDWRGAQEASDKARSWCWTAFWVGLIANVAVWAFYVMMIATMHVH
jgi:DNA-directed RNA polymerase subunit RPC12/RpoP